ncbi:hypothetical protein D3C73_817710 [compost metagenome]
MILVFTFPCREQSGDIRHLVIIDPHAAHGVMHSREDFHRNFAGIIAHEFFIDFDNAAQLDVQLLRVLVGEIQVHHVLAVNAQPLVDTYIKNLPGGNIARHQIPVRRIFLLQKVPRLAVLVGPDASAFTARRFRHQPQLVIAGNRGRMDLNEFTVGVMHSLLVYSAGSRSGVDDRVRCFAKNNAGTAARQNHRIRREGLNLHRLEILGTDAAAYAFIIQDHREEFPVLAFGDQAFGFPAAHLLIQRIQQLLAGRRTCKSCPVALRAAEPAEVEQPLRRAVEHDAHPVHQMDDPRCSLTHRLDRRLVGKKIAAVYSVVEMLPRRVSLAFGVHRSVDAALRADRMRSFDRNKGE